jgi:hypothetical protein
VIEKNEAKLLVLPVPPVLLAAAMRTSNFIRWPLLGARDLMTPLPLAQQAGSPR